MVSARYLVMNSAGEVEYGYEERSQARLAAETLSRHRGQPMAIYDLLTRRSWTVDSRSAAA